MSGALINLVRLNTVSDVDDTDYTAGELYKRHDEIKLEDPNGCPCAIPMPSDFDNIDYRYNYITGSIGAQGRIIRRKLSIGIDYIANEKNRQLEKWMDQRAHVLVAPNFGRNTEFSFRPILMKGLTYIDGGTSYDLTGNHIIQHTQATGTLLIWDEERRRFNKKPVSDSMPMFHTEGGAAIGSPRSVRNLMKPAYPEGATAQTGTGNSGWIKGGTDAAQITFTHNSGAFGHPDCPDTLAVAYTNAVSTSRTIEIKGLFDPLDGINYGGYTPTGAGDLIVCTWLRGQMPDDAKMFILGNSGQTEHDLSGKRFDGWTPVVISRYEADWSLSVPNVLLNLPSSDGVGGSFEIGPTQVQQLAGSAYNPGAYWTDSGSYTGSNDTDTLNAFGMPGQGTAIASFVIPAWWESGYALKSNIALIGTDSLSIRIIKDISGNKVVYITDSAGTESVTIPAAAKLTPGKINTVAFTWNGAAQSVYVNGYHIGDIDMAANKLDFGSSTTALRISRDGSGHDIFPGLLLSARIDEGAMTADEVANIHLALTDPVALQFAKIQRGRVYQITGIPQTVRAGAGGSQVLGMLTLEQVGYQHWLADPMNIEEIVR